MPVYQTPAPNDNFGNQPVEEEFPSFVKGWMITDIVFCALRGLMVPLSILGYHTIEKSDPLYRTALFEIGSNIALAIVGLTAAIMILNRVKEGIPVAYLAVVCTLATFGVGVWQLSINLRGITNPAERGGFIAGGVFVIVLRFVLLGFYVTAVNKAKDFLSRR